MSKHFIPSVEDVLSKLKYELTMAPDDSLQHFNQSNRINNFVKTINKKLFIQLYPYIRPTKLHIEISKLGRLHLHGTISFKSKLMIKLFFVDQVKNLTDHFTIAMNPYRGDIWDEYIVKQQRYEFPTLTTTWDPNDDVPKLKYKKIHPNSIEV